MAPHLESDLHRRDHGFLLMARTGNRKGGGMIKRTAKSITREQALQLLDGLAIALPGPGVYHVLWEDWKTGEQEYLASGEVENWFYHVTELEANDKQKVPHFMIAVEA